MSKSLLRLAILSAPLVLTACGEGWEVQRTSNYVPYDMERTAGTGVVYVRAKMLPKKELVAELVAEPVMEEIKAEAEVEEVKLMEEPEPVLEAEEIFTEAQQKGVASKKMTKIEDTAETVSMNEVKEESEVVKATYQEEDAKKELLTPMPDVEEKGEVFKDEEHSSLMMNDTAEKMTAEDYISQAPKGIVAPKVEVIKMNSYEPGSGESSMKTAGADPSNIEEEVAEVYENEAVQPQKQIIVPKEDVLSYLSIGEGELNEIYSQPF